MFGTGSEKQKPIGIKITAKMRRELQIEMKRTGLTRSALLKAAWAEYLERRPSGAARKGG